ncbi:unnamed protein product [Rotaria sordida]|uniref:Phytanoyl-CoA dioxygenase n=1 Tax=Rotaria sordida TaxID=392033 RepID=A0A813YWY3_9BILA|nr:unnamed protein product [Rotaria sordida]CAF1053501.1 unnamed protein product [Rotaria sordida]CAF3865264.1 unnamed protein product [Rotaria sordida]CAF4003791.1 unnamed protein product [Rotaria sordida]
MSEANKTSDNINTQIDYTTPTPRFSVTNDNTLKNGLAYLMENGYAVISDIMNQDEIIENKNLLWKFIENVSNGTIRRDDPETWSNGWPSFSTHGVIAGHGIGQSDFLWNVRSNRKVKKVFTDMWNDQQLVVSFDGCGIFRDWRYNPIWKTTGGWNHVDQNPKVKPDRCCVQGLISLTDQNEKTGGLIVYPRTHLRFTELSDVTKNSNDFVKVSDDHPIMNQGKTLGKLVHCRAGDLIVWDSRTVHCNSPAIAPEERNKDEPVDLLRIVAYVSMSPISFVRNQTLDEFREKRKQIVEDNCTLSHWSTECVLGGDVNTGLPKVTLDKFNTYQKALMFGFEDNNEE